MKRRMVVIGLAAAVVGCWAGWELSQFSAVDACLDAGGAWEERGSYCYGAPAAGK